MHRRQALLLCLVIIALAGTGVVVVGTAWRQAADRYYAERAEANRQRPAPAPIEIVEPAPTRHVPPAPVVVPFY
jgi:hypothetical protein